MRGKPGARFSADECLPSNSIRESDIFRTPAIAYTQYRQVATNLATIRERR